MADNLRHWSVLSKTDPKQTKGFNRAGGFKGTAIKPIYTVQKMTEHFGPCGIGWGIGEPVFQIVQAGEEILIYCTASIWYKEGDVCSEPVYGVGGDKVRAARSSGPFNSDEAFKAAYTDALSNAMKQIGMSADVHMGLFDDHKYVRDMEREFADEKVLPRSPETRQQAKAPEPPHDKRTGEIAYTEAEAIAFVDLMIGATEKAVGYGGATEIWNSNGPELDRLKQTFPARYDALLRQFKGIRSKLPREAA